MHFVPAQEAARIKKHGRCGEYWFRHSRDNKKREKGLEKDRRGKEGGIST